MAPRRASTLEQKAKRSSQTLIREEAARRNGRRPLPKDTQLATHAERAGSARATKRSHTEGHAGSGAAR